MVCIYIEHQTCCTGFFFATHTHIHTVHLWIALFFYEGAIWGSVSGPRTLRHADGDDWDRAAFWLEDDRSTPSATDLMEAEMKKQDVPRCTRAAHSAPIDIITWYWSWTSVFIFSSKWDHMWQDAGHAVVVTDMCSLTLQIGLSQMRSHTAACSKYQDYIEEGVRTTAQSQPAIIRWKHNSQLLDTTHYTLRYHDNNVTDLHLMCWLSISRAVCRIPLAGRCTPLYSDAIVQQYMLQIFYIIMRSVKAFQNKLDYGGPPASL